MYFEQGDLGAAVEAARNTPLSEPLNIIGHSWGSEDAARIAGAADRPVDTLIGVDPVSKPGVDTPRPDNVGTVVLVEGGSTSRGRGNAIERIGKTLGGGSPKAYRDPDIEIETPYRHEQFEEMMTFSPKGGTSAADMLERTAPKPEDEKPR